MKHSAKVKRLEARQVAYERSLTGRVQRGIQPNSSNFHKPGSLKK